ncbi:MAG TPA: AMP-binding protein [Acidimicrobiales bacterium]
MFEAMVMSDGGVVLGDRTVARAEVIDASRRAAPGLASLRVGAGDSVAILLRNDIPFFAVSLATRTLGVYAVPTNWHWRSGEIEHVLVDSGAKVLVVRADLLGPEPTTIRTPWPEPERGASAEVACIAADLATGPPVEATFDGTWRPHPNPDRSLRFLPRPITADEATGVGTLDGTVAGVAMMSLAVWAGGERLAVGICTSLVSPPSKRDRAPAIGEGA